MESKCSLALTAKCNGVYPFESWALTSDPFAHKYYKAYSPPEKAAQWRAVDSRISFELMSNLSFKK